MMTRSRSAARGPATPRRRALLLGMLIVGAALLLYALLPGARSERTAGPREGGILRVAVAGAAARVNPLDAGAPPAERDLSALIFTGLTRPGPDGAPQPALAQRWDVSDDARTFTFHLRPGLTWHDGRDLTATDVLFTAGALSAMGSRADARLLAVWSGATLTALDAETVRVELGAPFAALPSYAGFGLLPAHVLAGVPPDRLADDSFFSAPIGAGPFRLEALSPDGASLRRFPGYALGPAWLDGVELRFAASAPDAEHDLRAGAVDTALVGTSSDSAEAGAQAHVAVRSAYTMIVLNFHNPLFQDGRVRQALSLAVDRDGLASAAGGVPSDTPFSPNWWAADDRAPPAADPDAAAALLAVAGWQRGRDGISRKDGVELAFTLLVPEEGGRSHLADSIAAAWSGIGARVTVTSMPAAALVRDALVPRAFDAAMIGWDPGPDPDPFSAWDATMRGHPDGNFGDAADDQLDALAVEGRTAVTYDGRRAAYLRFADRFRTVTPGIVLFADTAVYAVRPPLAGPAAQALAEPAGRFAGVERWYLRRR